jgi:hypothetical protein
MEDKEIKGFLIFYFGSAIVIAIILASWILIKIK